jgi:hypothetical protein
MQNTPRIWLDYCPVRIGWVASGRNVSQIVEAATRSSCLWGGRFNPVIPTCDIDLADRLVNAFAVDILIPIEDDDSARTYIDRFPHLLHDRLHSAIFERRQSEFADIRHAVRRISKNQDKHAEGSLTLPSWDQTDALHPLFALLFGQYPTPSDQIADYRAGIIRAFNASVTTLLANKEVSCELLDKISPLSLTAYDMTRTRDHTSWLSPGIVLGSVTDFDDLTLFWNLRAAGATLCFYDQIHEARLKSFTNAFLDRCRGGAPGAPRHVMFWRRRAVTPGEDWNPGIDITDLPVSLADGTGSSIWNGPNVQPGRPRFSFQHRDVVPSFTKNEQRTAVSFALPDRPFDDGDIQARGQKFVVVVDAQQYGTSDSDLTFETPFIPQLNEFYGRNFYSDYDTARSQLGGLDKGAVGIITSISTQRLQVNAYPTFDWMTNFFSLCKLTIERSEPGLRCKRLIHQFGGLQGCRVLKIRGVRSLLRKYGVEDSFTRTGAITAIRDVDSESNTVGLDAFKDLHITYPQGNELTAETVLKYLLSRGVFRVGLEFKCPNCELPSWIHLDDVRTKSSCSYCDHSYDITSQLKDRDWRYRRSGIFGRNDDQLGGVPVALTLQQLSTSLNDDLIMHSTALKFNSAGADIEPCESDLVAIVAGKLGISETPVQVLFGEMKTAGHINEEDVRKLGKLADSIPKHLAQSFILFSKIGTFTAEEVRLAKTLNTQYKQRVILWSQDELEPYFLYERSRDRLADRGHASALTDMANATHQLWFT